MSNRRQIEEEPLNLVPIMNLVTILIPFLLLAMKSFELSVIDTTAPPISKDAKDKSDEIDEKDKPLALSVAITYKGLRIIGADEQLGIKKVDDAEADPNAAKEAGLFLECENQVCKDVYSYPWADLRKNLITIKGGPDDSSGTGIWCTGKDTDAVTFLPAKGVKYDVLVVAMDVTRSDTAINNDSLQIDQDKPASSSFNVTLDLEKKGSERCQTPASSSGTPSAIDKKLFPRVLMGTLVPVSGP